MNAEAMNANASGDNAQGTPSIAQSSQTGQNTQTSEKPLRDMLAICQDEMIMKPRIAALLKEGPKTVIELSEALGYPAYEVMVWLMAMRRYGEIEETGRVDVDGYFSYKFIEKTETEG